MGKDEKVLSPPPGWYQDPEGSQGAEEAFFHSYIKGEGDYICQKVVENHEDII
jgi:hypothetical protein